MLNLTQKKNRSSKRYSQNWKSFVKINEQRYIRKNNGKREKQNQHKTSKQRERLSKMYIKTKVAQKSDKRFDNNLVMMCKS